MTTSLAVIIPAFNEEKGISKCIRSVTTVLTNIKSKATLIIVNDGSTDNTLQILHDEKKKHKKMLTIVSYPKNKGYGAALATGIRTAIKLKYTYGLIMDSDLTNDPKDIPRFFSKIQEGYDLVKGSRYVKGGKAHGVPFKRRLPSIIGNRIASLLFMHSLKDNTNGFRIIRLSYAKHVPYKEQGFSHILEEVYHLKKKGAKITEIPVILTTRKNGSSSFTYTPHVYISYLKHPLRSFFRK